MPAAPEPEPFPDLFGPEDAVPDPLPEPEPEPAPEIAEEPLPLDEEPTLEQTQPLAPVYPQTSEQSQALPLGRLGALAALVTGLAIYSALAKLLPEIGSWPGVALVSLGVLPLTFALVWLALPAWRSPYLPAVILAGGGLAVLLEAFDLEVTADLAKLAAVTAAGWFFLRFFEEVGWVLLVALLIVPVDIFSVARGPTRQIINERPDVFDRLSISFHVPAEANYADLGLPDVLFFALFLGAAVRFHLRPGLTWIACTAGLALTLPIAVAFNLSGLPALPFISAGFVLANADLLWHQLRGHTPEPVQANGSPVKGA